MRNRRADVNSDLWVVYRLYVCGTNETFYIGCSSNVKRREGVHRSFAKWDTAPVYKKIRSIWSSGREFALEVLSPPMNEKQGRLAESKLICSIGLDNLCNTHTGPTKPEGYKPKASEPKNVLLELAKKEDRKKKQRAIYEAAMLELRMNHPDFRPKPAKPTAIDYVPPPGASN